MFRLHTTKKSLGFALVEIMIVAAVTSFLTSVIIPSLNEARQKGEDSRRTSSLRNLQTTIAEETNVGSLPYTNIFTTGKVRDQIMRFLDNTNIAEADVDMKADIETYAFVFPLKNGKYHCVDSEGVHKDVPGRIVATHGPYSCAIALGGTGAIDQEQIVPGARDVTLPDINTDGRIVDASVQSDDKIIIVGTFTDVNETASTLGMAFPGIARLNNDGTVDSNFVATITDAINNETMSGPFTRVVTSVDGQYIVLTNGSTVWILNIDANIVSTIPEITTDIAFLPDGSLVLAGPHSLKTYDMSGNMIVDFSQFFLREVGGKKDEEGKREIKKIAVSGYDIVVYGTFSSYQEQEVSGLVRIASSDGSLLASVSPSFDTQDITGIFADSPVTGSVYILGDFSTYNNSAARGIVHLNADLSLDENWAFNKSFHEFTSERNRPISLVKTPDDTQAVIVGDIFSYDEQPISGIVRVDNSTGESHFTFSGLLRDEHNVPTDTVVTGFTEGSPLKVFFETTGKTITISEYPASYQGTSASQIIRIYPY